MRYDQPQAFELRREGKTYREIQKLLGISRSTLCDWFKNEEWSKHIKKSNTYKNIEISVVRLEKLHEGRRLMLEKKYKKVEEDAVKEFELYKNDPLFMAGLMVYAGEGDKSSRNLTRMSNSEFYLHLVFIRFSEKFLNIGRDKIKVWLLLYPDHNIEECTETWSKKLQISKNNFNKSQVIVGKEKTRKLQYGVGNSIISSTSLKKKMMKWLELCKIHFD
ncbi:MAG: helix-turn-helix domain-containing protein [bacterium]